MNGYAVDFSTGRLNFSKIQIKFWLKMGELGLEEFEALDEDAQEEVKAELAEVEEGEGSFMQRS